MGFLKLTGVFMLVGITLVALYIEEKDYFPYIGTVSMLGFKLVTIAMWLVVANNLLVQTAVKCM